MEMIPYLRKLFAYDEWANREALASLKAADTPPPRSLKLMGHILAAEWLWLGRLTVNQKAVAVWPEPTGEQCAAQIADLTHVWAAFLDGLTPAKLSESVTYTNTKGESWTNTVEDILMHVVMHSVYHRAQIAADLRASAHTPAYTDFIHSIRQGFVK